MTDKTVTQFFDKRAAETYDERQQRLAPITDNLHFLIGLVLKDLPSDARILSVGVGTGTEMIRLAKANPGWRFVGIDPSPDMLETCRRNLETHDVSTQCDLVEGYLADMPDQEPFDAVLCLLVTHFLLDQVERQAMYATMASHLKPGGYLISADISGDRASPAYAETGEKWKSLHKAAGSSPEDVEKMMDALHTHVAILPAATIETMLAKAGFARPTEFFQAFLIHAWFARKDT